MKNKIIGIAILACAVLILFTGTASALGTVAIGSGPRIIDILTSAPTGQPYTALSMLEEALFDLNPLLWIPDFTLSVANPSGRYHSTFSKFSKILFNIEDSNVSEDFSINIVNTSTVPLVIAKKLAIGYESTIIAPGTSSMFYATRSDRYSFYLDSVSDSPNGKYYYLTSTQFEDYIYLSGRHGSWKKTSVSFFYDGTYYVHIVDAPIS